MIVKLGAVVLLLLAGVAMYLLHRRVSMTWPQSSPVRHHFAWMLRFASLFSAVILGLTSLLLLAYTLLGL